MVTKDSSLDSLDLLSSNLLSPSSLPSSMYNAAWLCLNCFSFDCYHEWVIKRLAEKLCRRMKWPGPGQCWDLWAQLECADHRPGTGGGRCRTREIHENQFLIWCWAWPRVEQSDCDQSDIHISLISLNSITHFLISSHRPYTSRSSIYPQTNIFVCFQVFDHFSVHSYKLKEWPADF